MTGTTNTGFNFTVSEDALDDMELLDAIAEMDEDATKISFVVKKVLGVEQRAALYAHIKKTTGVDRVTAEALAEEISDIFTALGETGKN